MAVKEKTREIQTKTMNTAKPEVQLICRVSAGTFEEWKPSQHLSAGTIEERALS